MLPPVKVESKAQDSPIQTKRLPLRPPASTRVFVPELIPAQSRYAAWGWKGFNTALLVGSLPAAILIGVPVALAVKLESWGTKQPIFFRQRRMGLDGKVFTLIKFRTMNARPAKLQEALDAWGDGDLGRTTRIGRFLRKSHLDEIPQLLNVLRREMAVVGPRPEMVEVADWADKKVSNFSDRLGVLPGITGWAQVKQGYCGQDPAEYREKLALDMEYIQSRTLGMDVRIVAHTAYTMFALRGWRIAKRKVTR